MTEPEALTDGEASSDALPDDELMLAYAAGSQRAFEALYARHKGALYRYFLRQLGDERAGDCFQNLWLRVIRARARYRPSGSFRGYLFTMAHNVLMDEHRKTMRNPARQTDNPEETYDGAAHIERQLDRTQLRRHLHRLLVTLPLAQREVWILKQETDLSTKEIAELTQTSEEGVKSRLRYATSKLKGGMSRYAARD